MDSFHIALSYLAEQGAGPNHILCLMKVEIVHDPVLMKEVVAEVAGLAHLEVEGGPHKWGEVAECSLSSEVQVEVEGC